MLPRTAAESARAVRAARKLSKVRAIRVLERSLLGGDIDKLGTGLTTPSSGKISLNDKAED